MRAERGFTLLEVLIAFAIAALALALLFRAASDGMLSVRTAGRYEEAVVRARSHLAAAWGPAQDRAQTYAWLRTIRQLHLEAPKMKIVPGYDYLWLIKQRAAGAIAEWQPDPAPPPIARAAAPHDAARHRQDNLPQANLR